jgi:hypothetical protein
MPDTVGPSSNELRLGKKVLELEKERDALAVSDYKFLRGRVLIPGRAGKNESESRPSNLDYRSRTTNPT